MTARRHFVVAAGGTGGHMVPAHVLADELLARGHQVSLITDERGLKIPGLFERVPRETIPSASISGMNPIAWFKAWRRIRAGRRAAQAIYARVKPAAVIGFGGYPALPALLAAADAGIPTVIHEQNAVLGRVNRLLGNRADAIATAYAGVERLSGRQARKVVLVGNPVRADILALRDAPFPDFGDKSLLRLLVIGGSQGATILSDVVPAALDQLPPALKRRCQVVQQCRAEDIERAGAVYDKAGVVAELTTYIGDMAGKLAWAHLLIARAGASTIAELTAAGRPAILVPLPTATDDHQTANARELVDAGGAWMIPQSAFTADALARRIEAMVSEPGALANAAKCAASVGRPRAGAELANLVERLAGVSAPAAEVYAPSKLKDVMA